MQSPKKVVSFRVIIQALFFVLVMPFLPLLISGQWNWWEGWAYGILGFISFVISRVLAAKQNPDLIAERAKFMQHEDAQSWDKKIIPLLGLVGIVSVVIAGLDRLFSWTPIFSVWVRILGLLLLVAGYTLASYALVVNRYFSGMVRLQTDRGQHVIMHGPYRWVRHPGYAGGLLAYLATPLLLNSIWLLIPILLTVALYVLRTSLEDRFLQENLTGYREYAKLIRFRLLPGIW
ncbi:MAG: isoprenylcysteine carboxylmethyltransferase family protein [Anaerolineaceae bacterium]|nr:isoprenylcysteine carboxylmethyltransferase family protein [Anaerolineaceae bacterium]